MKITSNQAKTGHIEKYIGSAYDNVKRVSEELDSIINVSDALVKDVDFEVLANVLLNIKDNAADLAALAQADLIAISNDLNKGNFLGNRKIDINLLLNMEGVDEELIRDDPDAAEAIWIDASKTVFYDSATITFVDGTVVELPFEFDENPIFISTHGDLLSQFNRFDNTTAVAQETLINNIVAVNNYTYRVTLNGIAFDYIADSDATVPEIVSGLVQSINVTEANGSVPITAIDEVTSIRLVADVAGEQFIAYGNGNMTFSTLVDNVEGGALENDFLAKLEDTGMIGIAQPVIGELVRFYDIIGVNSNLERIQLNAISGNYIYQHWNIYWAKTTSALQTLAMRAGDIIKLGNELDNIIILAGSITEVLDVQLRIPQLIDTFQADGTPNGDVTIYNKLYELNTLYDNLVGLLLLFEDMKPGGNNFIQSVGTDLQVTEYVTSVGTDLQAIDSKVIEVAEDLQTNNYVTTVGADLQDIASKIIEASNDLQAIDSKIIEVANNLQTINTIGVVVDNIVDVNTTATNIADVNTVSTNIVDVNTVAANIVDVQNAEANAQTAIDQAQIATDQAIISTEQAVISTTQAGISTTQAGIATTKSNEIKNVSVGSTITGASGTNASVVYNPTSGEFTFIVPQGIKGDRGEAFQVNAVGLIADRPIYDNRLRGFSFLALDQDTIYFKLSDTIGDWSAGAGFGKGDKGDIGDTGNGIADISNYSTTNPANVFGVGGFSDTYRITYTDTTTDTFTVYNGKGISSITFTSTTDVSGLAAQSGATDTYTVTFTDETTTTFPVHNGLDSALQSVQGRVGDVVITAADIGLENVDNTSDINKPISTATQQALNLKADAGDLNNAKGFSVAMAIVFGG